MASRTSRRGAVSVSGFRSYSRGRTTSVGSGATSAISSSSGEAPWMSRRRAAESAAYMPAKPAPMMTSRMWFAPGLSVSDEKTQATALGRDEREQLGVDEVGVGRAHAVRKALIDPERAPLQQFRRQDRGVGDGDDRIVST